MTSSGFEFRIAFNFKEDGINRVRVQVTGDHKVVVSRCSLKCRAILVGACHGVSARQFSSTGSVAVHGVVWLDKLAILQCCGVSSHSAFAIFSDV